MRRKRYARRIADLEMKDMDGAERDRQIDAIYDEAGDFAPSYEMMKAEIESRELSATERQQRSLPRRLRD